MSKARAHTQFDNLLEKALNFDSWTTIQAWDGHEGHSSKMPKHVCWRMLPGWLMLSATVPDTISLQKIASQS
jgi:hypothetical protein